MKTDTIARIGKACSGGVARFLVLFLTLAALAGCDTFNNVLSVESPDLIPAGSLEDPANAELLVTGAVADFECAYGAFVVLGGLITDEFVDASPTASRWPYDRRRVRPGDSRYAEFGCVAIGTYSPLSTARFSATNALVALESYSDEEVENRAALIATAAAYSGYSNLLLGEMFCTGVLLGPDLEPGGEVPNEQLFERAVERFTRAIEAARAAGNEAILNLALVGRARALLDLGRIQQAAESARQVPENFVYVATASNVNSRRQNRVYQQNQLTDLVTISEEYRDLAFQGVPDPRVEVFNTGELGFDGTTPIFAARKYPSLSAPIPIATGEEAQLIIAEAALAAGNPQVAVDIINELHAQAGLPAFQSGDPAEIMDHLIQERRRALFLEGHRLFDTIRFELPFDPAPGTPYRTGGTYGTTRCLPLPLVETANNPNI